MRQTYTREAVEAARTHIAKMPPKHKSTGLSMREVVAELTDDVHQALEQGYRVADIADVLTQHNMAIKPGTLRAYLPPRNQERSSEPSRKKNRKGSRKASETPSDEKAKAPSPGLQSGKFTPREDRESI